MKTIFLRILYAFVLLGIFLFFNRCAQPGSPSGGPPDKEGPLIRDTLPLPRSLNFQGDEIVLKFNEFIKTPTYGKEIFISPFMAETPLVKVSGKKLKIKFKEVLRPNTTYVISFIDIKDYYANNSIDPPFTLAFSTGSIIDSMQIEGRVLNRNQEGVEDITLMLFEADSIEGHDFLDKRPAYLTKTDKNGVFKLEYLRNAAYHIYGISDIDRSNTYSIITEPLALAPQAEVNFTDSQTVSIELIAFSLDNKPPALRKYQWLSDSVLLCEFTRGLRADSLRLGISDTLGQDSLSLETWSYIDQQLLVELPRKREQAPVLHIHAMTDSLGRAADSSLLLRAGRIEKPDLYPLFRKVMLEPMKQGYQFMLPRTLDEKALQAISLRDTGDRPIPIRYESDAFRLLIKPDTAMTPSLFYFIWLEGSLLGEKDTIFRYKVSPWEPESYGSLSGSLLIKDYDGPFVVYFDGPQTFTLTDTLFDYRFLSAGDYKLSLLLDEDGSGSWTPGSLQPYKLPERIVHLNSPLTIRANWTIEDQIIEFETTVTASDSLSTDNPQNKTPGSRSQKAGTRN